MKDCRSRLVFSFDRGNPIVEPLPLSDGQNLGGRRDVARGVEMRAGGVRSCELVAVVVGERVWVGEQPAGQLAGLRWPSWRRCGRRRPAAAAGKCAWW